MDKTFELSELDVKNINLLIKNYYRRIFNFLNNKSGKNPNNIDFIRLYFSLEKMKIITVYSHKGSKRKYYLEGVKYEDSKFEDSLDYLIICNLEIDKFKTWSAFIENYDALEFTYGSRLYYLNNFIKKEYAKEIRKLRMDDAGL
ncbi:hypothetical protein [Psychroflexus montanilacus]|uniref:hypothetical protein n=1 Tax=Psychroflexus montanilacus TaxID=2873598 RepID=UPI001CCAAD87|nr:hypothetical protein [Psychroflexus montanilacus]MBZ9652657.1 hypothetical protein [Psychroflexus montanilacus]